MTKQIWHELSPSIILALGIILATHASGLAEQFGALVLIGPVLLGISMLAADVAAARLCGKAFLPAPAALILAGTFLIAAMIMLPNGARFIQGMIPVMGITALLTNSQWTRARAGNCAWKQSQGRAP
jgi:hypothetical protein